MKKIEIFNITRNITISTNGILADRFFSRLKGLIGSKSLEEDEAILIMPCKSVHTFFMSYPIDVIFVNKEDVIYKIVENLTPNRASGYFKESRYVIEISAGEAQRKNIGIGDKISCK